MNRGLDLILGLFLALITLPVVAGLAVVVVMTSGWPAFYGARRAGLRGRPFTMWKLRSMRAPAVGEPAVTMLHDRRITRVGAWMRRHRLDELPQLWNVVGGEMSLVGPRPEDIDIARRAGFTERGLLNVRPGITGLCQLEMLDEAELLGRDGSVEHYERDLLPRKMAIDLDYLRRRSLLLDIHILGRTIAGMVAGGRSRR